MTEVPTVPQGVLLQNLVVDARGREGGYRIHDDGRFERRSVGGEWQEAPTLAPAQVTAVRAAIGDAGLSRLEPRYEPAAAPADDGGSTLHVHAGRQLARVEAAGVAAVLLGAEQGHVGVGQQRLARTAVVREQGDADAGGRMQTVAAEVDGLVTRVDAILKEARQREQAR